MLKQIAVILVLLGPVWAQGADSPEVTHLKKEVEGLFEFSKKVNAGGEDQKKARAQMDSAMDWDRIAKDCLGKDIWKKQNSQQTGEFQKLLKEVIIKTAYSRLDNFWKNANYEITTTELTGNESHVAATFKVDGEDFSLDYYLSKKGNRWVVFDIAYEGVRYSSNIHEQLMAFLKEKNFANLLDKLRKRKQELDKPAPKKKNS